ncbi:MAG: hypothetical protein IKG93_01955 [Clostridiales bacterium]|nr:hypothetical protein [Clostridiales bacterium]
MRKTVLAEILAAGMLLCACSSTQTESTRRPKQSVKEDNTIEDKDREDDPDTSKSQTGNVSSEDTSASESEPEKTAGTEKSEETEATTQHSYPTITPIPFQSIDDIYSLYAYVDPQTLFPSTTFCCNFISGPGEYTSFDLNMKSKDFHGEYMWLEETIIKDYHEVRKSEFSGNIEAPERIDDHTLKIKFSSFETKHFDEFTETYDYPAKTVTDHVVYADPKALNSASDLLVYLPNTKVADLPEEWINYIKRYGTLYDGEYLGQTILYNEKEQSLFFTDVSRLDLSSCSELTDKQDLELWCGEYGFDLMSLNIYQDDSTGKVYADFSFPGSALTCTSMNVVGEKDEEDNIMYAVYVYGNTSQGTSVIFELSMPFKTHAIYNAGFVNIVATNDPAISSLAKSNSLITLK